MKRLQSDARHLLKWFFFASSGSGVYCRRADYFSPVMPIDWGFGPLMVMTPISVLFEVF